jgi:hypothetical protein
MNSRLFLAEANKLALTFHSLPTAGPQSTIVHSSIASCTGGESECLQATSASVIAKQQVNAIVSE